MYLKEGNLPKCKEIFEDVEKSGVQLRPPLFTTMIKACGMCGDVDAADHYFHKMKEGPAFPNVIVYNTMIDICRKSGDTKKVIQLFGEMEKKRVVLSEVT